MRRAAASALSTYRGIEVYESLIPLLGDGCPLLLLGADTPPGLFVPLCLVSLPLEVEKDQTLPQTFFWSINHETSARQRH